MKVIKKKKVTVITEEEISTKNEKLPNGPNGWKVITGLMVMVVIPVFKYFILPGG